MLKNDFVIKVNKTSLVLKAEAETLRDIASVLDHLVNMVHILRSKAELLENRKARLLRSRQFQINQANRIKSLEIYNRFLIHLNNGCNGNKLTAVQMIKTEYHLQSVEADYFIAQGKKILKEENNLKQYPLF